MLQRSHWGSSTLKRVRVPVVTAYFFTVRFTVEVPSPTVVLNSTFALLNMSSFRETMMNCAGG